MKQKLEWHKQNLKASKVTLERYNQEFFSISRKIDRTQSEINFLNFQIQEAEKEGKDSFDAEKYRINHKDKFKDKFFN